MKNIIEELWNGEILPQENLTKDNPEYQELRHRQIKKQQELVKTLSDEQNENSRITAKAYLRQVQLPSEKHLSPDSKLQ